MNKILNKNKELIILITLIILLIIPNLIEHIINLGIYKQLIVGTLVNTILFISTYYIKEIKRIILLGIVPSLTNILTGFLFLSLTPYMINMIPFICIGNILLMYFNIKNKTLIGIITKVSIIFIGFKIISTIFNYPTNIINIMNLSMGIYQLITCLTGYILSKLYLKLRS